MKKAFKMKLNHQMQKEYKKRHQKVDLELENLFKQAKVKTYSIWFDQETDYLFGYIELLDLEKWKEVPNTKACQKWWKFMQDIMLTNDDSSPVSVDLEKVYEYKEQNE